MRIISIFLLSFIFFARPVSAAATNAYTFDGGDYASMSNVVAELNGQSAMTISLWAKFTDTSAANCLFGHTGGKLYFCFDGDGTIGVSGKLLAGQNSGTNANISTSTVSLSDNTWYHFVVVYNASDWTIYVNAVSEPLDKLPFAVTLNGLGSGDFYVGYSSSLGNKFFDGTMDEFQVYNTALDQTAVTNLYAGGSPTEISASATGLIAYWKMNGTATTGAASVIDSQTVGNNTGQLGANTASEADDPTTAATGIVSVANAAPTETGTFPTDITVVEDTASNLDLSGLTLADADSAGDMPLTLTATGGTMAASDAGGVVIGGTGTGTLSLTGTVSEIDTYLNTSSNIKYTSVLNENGGNSQTVAVKINDQDGSGDVALGTFNVDITAVNDAPTVTSSGTTSLGSVNEETPLTGVLVSTILAGGTVSYADVDSGASSGLAISLATGTGTWEFSTNNSTWTVFGAVAGNAALLLNSTSYVRFTGGTEYAGTPALTFQAWDQTTDSASSFGSAQTADATINGTTTAYSSNSAGATLTVNATDDAPTGSGAATPASFTEDTQGDLNLSAFTVADIDSASVTVTLTASEGALAASTSGGVTVGGTSGALTLTGSPANINTYLDTTTNVAYTGATNDNGTPAATITVTGADATTSAVAMGTVSLNITAVDDAPTVSAVPAESVVLSVAQYIDLAASAVADIDSASITASISVDTGTLVSDDAGGLHNTTGANIVDNGGVIEVTGTPTQVNTYLDDTAELKFTSTASTANVTLTVSIDDGFNTPVTDTATISVLDVAKPTASNYTDTTNEDIAVTVFSNTELPTTVDTDGGTAHAVEYITIDISTVTGGVLSLTGTPTGGTSTIGGVTFDTATGDLSGTANIAIGDIGDIVFTPTANLNGTGAGDFDWSVTDTGGDTSPAATYTLDITAVNDDPTGISEPASIAYVEETADDLDISAIAIDDVDSASLDLVLTVGSGTLAASNGGSVTVANSGTSAITLTGAPANIDTYLNTASNIQYTPVTDDTGTPATTVVITASDGDGASNINLATINMNISNVNDEPTITGTNDTATLAGGAGTAVVFSSNDIAINVTAKDPADLIASVVLTISNVTDAEVIKIDGSGDIDLKTSVGSTDLTNIAYSIVYSGSTSTITYTGMGAGTMTQSVINTALNGMTYENSVAAPTEADRVFVISQIVDNGSTGGSHDNTWSMANVFSTITVVDASKPTASNYTDSTTEDVAISVFSNTELPTTVDTATSDPIEYISIITGNISGGVLSLTGTPTGGTSTVGAISFDTATGDLTGTVNIAIGDIGDLVFTPTTDLAGTGAASIIWTVTDNAGHTSPTATYTLNITNTSDDPLGADKTIALLTTASHTFAASDFGFSDVDTGDALNRVRIDVQTLTGGTLKLSNVTVNDADWIALANIGNLVYAPTAAGSDTFTFTVEDDSDNSTDATPNTITFTVTPDNTAPVISSGISTSVTMSEDGEPTAFSLTLSASDANADTLSWAINGGASNGIAYTTGTGNSKAIIYTPSANFFGNDNFTVQVSDGALSDTILVNVNVTSVNDIPVITGTPATSIAEGANYSFTPSTSDVDSTSFIYSITNKPSWATFSTTSGALTGTPDINDVGVTSNITITVADAAGATASLAAFSLTVANVNDAPSISGAPTTQVDEDSTYSFTPTVTDVDEGDVHSFSISGHPDWMLFDEETGSVSGTPVQDDVGVTSDITITVNDNSGAENSTDSLNFSVVVNNINQKPTAIADRFELTLNGTSTYVLDVLSNDIDIDGDTLIITGATTSIGSVTHDRERLTVTTQAGFVGQMKLLYTITDGSNTFVDGAVDLLISGELGASVPVITVPEDVDVNATGLYTKVDLGVATAVNSDGKPVAISLVNGNALFKPGSHIAYWQATDPTTGLTSVASQQVIVNPLISLGKNQIVVEGKTALVNVILNGEAPNYPVTVTLNVTGSADDSDYIVASNEVIITSGKQAQLMVDIIQDNLSEGDETLTLSINDGNVGSKSSHVITIVERNIAPALSLVSSQDNESRQVITSTGGLVTVQATVSDANDDNVSNVWSYDSTLNINQLDDNTLELDPSELSVGVYRVGIISTDDGMGNLATTKSLYLAVVASLVELTDIDTDGDRIPDNEEGYGDADQDGIPDFQDAIAECNVMPEQASIQDAFLVEGEPGICLRKGNTLAAGETGGLQLTNNDLENSIGTDNEAIFVGGIFDYIVTGLPEAGQTYQIVLPQLQPIPTGPVYRKYSENAGWGLFVEDANNQLHSTAGTQGYCPPPASALWTSGLTAGHWCVQLTIEDGGPNDNDGISNGTIIDPGGVSVLLTDNALPVAQADSVRVKRNQATVIDVLANDTDADQDTLTLGVVSATFGVVSITADNKLAYQSATNFVGQDTVAYSLSDGNGGTASSTVDITVYVNDAPIALDDTASTDDRTAIVINVLANDTDADGDNLVVVSATVDNGSVVINEDGTLTYTAASGFNGTALITYIVDDGQGDQASAQVSVTVKAYQSVTVKNESKGGSMGLMIIVLAGVVLYRSRRKRSLVNKHIMQGAAALAVATSMNAAAAEPQWFLTGSIGKSQVSESTNTPSDIGITSRDIDKSDASYSVGGGVKYDAFAFTVSYEQLGEASASFSGDTLNANSFHQALAESAPKLVDGISLQGQYTFWQNDVMHASVGLGVLAWELDYTSKLNDSVINMDEDDIDLFYNLALGYTLTEQIDVSLKVSRYNLSVNDVNNIALGVTYHF